MSAFGLIQSPWKHPWENAIYDSMTKGFPNTKRNGNGHKVLWGLHRTGMNIMKRESYTYIDTPYYGRIRNDVIPGSYWRWAYNSMHDVRQLKVPSDRFESWNVKLEPWKKDGDFVLICPSSENVTKYFYSMRQRDWIEKTKQEIKKYTNKPVRVRLKPRKSARVQGPDAETVSMKSELEGCYALVTCISICAIDALLEGVPVFSDSNQCPSAWCTNKSISNINNIEYNDREQLFFNLAYKQYSIEEYQNGVAYETISKHVHNYSK
jgi:hypothetical protein